MSGSKTAAPMHADAVTTGNEWIKRSEGTAI
jgi:hypothetical protein